MDDVEELKRDIHDLTVERDELRARLAIASDINGALEITKGERDAARSAEEVMRARMMEIATAHATERTRRVAAEKNVESWRRRAVAAESEAVRLRADREGADRRESEANVREGSRGETMRAMTMGWSLLPNETEKQGRARFLAAFLDSAMYDNGVKIPEGSTVEGIVADWLGTPVEQQPKTQYGAIRKRLLEREAQWEEMARVAYGLGPGETLTPTTHQEVIDKVRATVARAGELQENLDRVEQAWFSASTRLVAVGRELEAVMSLLRDRGHVEPSDGAADSIEPARPEVGSWVRVVSSSNQGASGIAAAPKGAVLLVMRTSLDSQAWVLADRSGRVFLALEVEPWVPRVGELVIGKTSGGDVALGVLNRIDIADADGLPYQVLDKHHVSVWCSEVEPA